jgi:S-phase kinase-associated protein 1
MVYVEEQDEEEAQEIPLPNVKSPILAKVIEFCRHYKVEAMNEIEKV